MIRKQKSENVCPKCGKPIVQNASYCAGCGARVFHNEDGAQTADPYVGTIIDNTFEIESILGTGSMGIVYKARHRALDCYVALKVLRQDFIQDRVVLARFQREAQAASSLSHPNVIRIFDYGKTSLNAPYIAMECLEGRELADLVLDKDNPLSQKRICSIALQTCQALNAAHSASIIHRDLKPANIIIIPKDGYDFVKVLDFGIAKIIDVEGEGLTREGAICGTPAFMSPEQVVGRKVTPASDLFSMGSIMYYMLTTKLPFQGNNMIDMAQSILTTVPTPPSRVRIDKWVDPHLEAICLKALEKEPQNRYASAFEMAKALENALPLISDFPTGRPKIVINSSEYSNDPDAETCCSIQAMDDEDDDIEGGTVVEMPAMLDSTDSLELKKTVVSDSNPLSSSAISIVGEALSDVLIREAESKELAPQDRTVMHRSIDRDSLSSRMEESRDEILARRKKMMFVLVSIGCLLCIVCLAVLFLINSLTKPNDDDTKSSDGNKQEIVITEELKNHLGAVFGDGFKNGILLVDLKTHHVVGFDSYPELVSQYELAAEKEKEAEEEEKLAKLEDAADTDLDSQDAEENADNSDAEENADNSDAEEEQDQAEEEAAKKKAEEEAAKKKAAEEAAKKKKQEAKKSSDSKKSSTSKKSTTSKSSGKSSGSAKLNEALKLESSNRAKACEMYKALLKDSTLSQAERIKVQGKVRSCGRVTI